MSFLKWQLDFKKWLLDNKITMAEFSRVNGIPRQTTNGWLLKPGIIPKPDAQLKIFDVTGIRIENEPVGSEIPPMLKTDKIIREYSSLIRSIASQIEKNAPILLFFIEHSSKQEREHLRLLMGIDLLQDVVDGSRGLFSEKAREIMIEERNKRLFKKN